MRVIIAWIEKLDVEQDVWYINSIRLKTAGIFTYKKYVNSKTNNLLVKFIIYF